MSSHEHVSVARGLCSLELTHHQPAKQRLHSPLLCFCYVAPATSAADVEHVLSCKITLCGALGSHGHCPAVAPCSTPLDGPSGGEGEPRGDSRPWCWGPGDSAALAHVGGSRRGVDLF